MDIEIECIYKENKKRYINFKICVPFFITNRKVLSFWFFNLRELSVNEFQEELPYNASLEALLITNRKF